MTIDQARRLNLSHIQSKGLEVLAVLANLLYTFLYLRGNEWCFFFGFLGSLSFVILCYHKKLLAESGLQVFYMAMAIYGFANIGTEWRIAHVAWSYHLGLISVAGLGTFALARLLKKNTESQLPGLDSFTTIFSIGATWLMVNFIHENWLYWIVIDLLSIYLYIKRGMYLGAILFVIYTVMAIDGFFSLGLFTW
jgi:nicotinamide mononucleotide transporter